MTATLIILAGLPGAGKSSIARELAQRMPAVWLRVDTIEQAVLASGIAEEAGPAGYMAAYGVARDNLQLGLNVVADCVNSLELTRAAWVNVAAQLGLPSLMVEVVCSDEALHRQRVQDRKADIAGHVLPRWDEVKARAWEPWERERMLIDTAVLTPESAAQHILACVPLTPTLSPEGRGSKS